MEVTAVIPNWNGLGRLRTLLPQLAQQTFPLARVIVVDNGSEDGSPEAAELLQATVIRLRKNHGFATAVNAGIAECDTELVAVLNNDVELEPDWLARVVEPLSSGDCWFATGRLLSAADHSVIDGTFDAVCRGCCAWRCGHGRPDGPIWRKAQNIRSTPFTAAIFRRELFALAGPLDETFESYLEDVDFGIRCASKGYSGRYVPEAVAYHAGGGTLGAWHPRTVRQIARNQLFLVARHYPGVSIFKNGWAIAVAHLLWGLVALRHGAGLPYLRGKFEGLRRFGEVRRAGNANVPRLLRESERQIFELQAESGFDWYWRWYFALT